MNFFGTAVLIAWIPAVLIMFMVMPARRAVLSAFLIGWLFLPNGGYRISGIPDYTKLSATSLGVLIGILIFDNAKLLSIRPRWFDLPMLLWCLSPMASSLSNGLGAYDGLSVIASHLLSWGLPYLIGRMYFTDAAALGELAIGILTFALVYVPLIVFENRMSAILHYKIYGSALTGSENYYEGFGIFGWRPSVFMQNSLALTLFMATCTVLAFWLWMGGSTRRIWGLPLGPIALILMFSTILCKSLGPNLLMFCGAGALLASKKLNFRLPLYCLIAVAPLYMGLRATRMLDGKKLVSVAESLATQRRAESLATRMGNEDLLVAKALERPAFGWGGWARSRIRDESGKDVTKVDGLWVIAIGQQGLLGLSGIYLAFLVPCLLLLNRYPARLLADPTVALLMAFAVMIVLYAIDGLFNAMPNPLFLVAMGGLGSVYAAGARVSSVASYALVRGDDNGLRGRRAELSAH